MLFSIGDDTNVATSKAGCHAHFEAETVVENLLREIDGKSPLQTFDGHANCFVETGNHKAMLPIPTTTSSRWRGLPAAGRRPVFAARGKPPEPLGKPAFKWVYWNMLLPGPCPTCRCCLRT